MENQELMKLCFLVALIMQWEQDGNHILKKEHYYIFRDGTFCMYPENLTNYINTGQWFPPDVNITQKQVTEVLEFGFNLGYLGIVKTEDGKVVYRKTC